MSSENSNNGNVIQFETLKPSWEKVEIPYEKKYQCRHARLQLVMDRRTVFCKDCETHFDAFDFLCMWADGDIRLQRNLKGLKNECKVKREELEELKRDEKH